MTVQVTCQCGYRRELPDEWRGKKGKCPQCQSVLQIPTSDGDQSAPATPSDQPMIRQAWPVNQPRFRPGTIGYSGRLLWITGVVAGLLLLGGGVLLLITPTNEVAQTEPAPIPPPLPKTGTEDLYRPKVKINKQADDNLDALFPKSTEPKAGNENRLRVETPEQVNLTALPLQRMGIALPTQCALLEVDGIEIPIKSLSELTASATVPIILPKGRHTVRFQKAGSTTFVEPDQWFTDFYIQSAGQFRTNGRLDFAKLLEASHQSMDRFEDPVVPHLWGNYYFENQQWDAARRHFRWALRIMPTFAPSYYNLAILEHQQNNHELAGKYLHMGDLWNIQNAYGLAQRSVALYAKLDVNENPENHESWFREHEGELSETDQNMVAVLTSASDFAVDPLERVKIINNLGAYFESEGNASLALEHYRNAMGMLRNQSTERAKTVVRHILENLTRLCHSAAMPEQERYVRLLDLMEP